MFALDRLFWRQVFASHRFYVTVRTAAAMLYIGDSGNCSLDYKIASGATIAIAIVITIISGITTATNSSFTILNLGLKIYTYIMKLQNYIMHLYIIIYKAVFF